MLFQMSCPGDCVVILLPLSTRISWQLPRAGINLHRTSSNQSASILSAYRSKTFWKSICLKSKKTLFNAKPLLGTVPQTPLLIAAGARNHSKSTRTLKQQISGI